MKFTVDGNVIEGTPEELAELMKLMGEGVSEVAEEVLAPKFKEGDRVKTLADGEDGDIKAGEVGTIDWISDSRGKDGDSYYIFVETDDSSDYFRPQDLELVTEQEKPRKPGEYKKGDIVSDGTGDAMFTVLAEHEIVSRSVRFPENIWRDLSEVELVAPVESRVDIG